MISVVAMNFEAPVLAASKHARAIMVHNNNIRIEWLRLDWQEPLPTPGVAFRWILPPVRNRMTQALQRSTGRLRVGTTEDLPGRCVPCRNGRK